MTTLFFRAIPRRVATHGALQRSTQRTLGAMVLRGTLLVACAASVAIAWRIRDPSVAVLADPELARLLRGMAPLKGPMVVATIAILLWRFGHSIAPRIAATYVVSAGLMAAAAAMIWQLTALLPAAAACHAGLIVAWRADDDLPVPSKLFA